MPNTPNSKILSPAEIFKVLKAAQENGRLEYLASIAREIARLDPAYVAHCAALNAASPETSMNIDETPLPSTNGVQIEELKWTHEKGSDFWRCTKHDDYHIQCWWESDSTTDRDPSIPHYFVINEDDDDRFDTIEAAMIGAQEKLTAFVNSYLVSPISTADHSEDAQYQAGREAGLREGAEIAADFVWKRYKEHDGIVGSHDYEKVSETILEKIEYPDQEEENDASPKP